MPLETLLIKDDRDRGRGVKVSFDPYGSDTVVYVHIQKTGGSESLEHLVTAQIPIEVVYSKNTTKQPARDPDTQLVPLCRTSKISGWQRGTDFFHHEMCPRDWIHSNGQNLVSCPDPPTKKIGGSGHETIKLCTGVTVIMTSPLFGTPVQDILGYFAPPCKIFLGNTVSLMVPLGKY